MSLVRKLVWSGVVLGASVASAQPRFGVSTDVGVPDGLVTSFVVRPVSWFRAHAGVGYNAVSPGLRAGATLALPTWFSPTLSVAYGRYREGDANPVVRMVTGDSAFHSGILDRVGYAFADGYVGLQLGRERVAFSIEAGYSRVTGRVRGLGAPSDAMTSNPEAATTFAVAEDPRVVAWTVSARIGLTLYLR